MRRELLRLSYVPAGELAHADVEVEAQAREDHGPSAGQGLVGAGTDGVSSAGVHLFTPAVLMVVMVVGSCR